MPSKLSPFEEKMPTPQRPQIRPRMEIPQSPIQPIHIPNRISQNYNELNISVTLAQEANTDNCLDEIYQPKGKLKELDLSFHTVMAIMLQFEHWHLTANVQLSIYHLRQNCNDGNYIDILIQEFGWIYNNESSDIKEYWSSSCSYQWQKFFKCGKTGHIKRGCPEKDLNYNS